MTENEEKIPAVVYVLGIVAGAISAYAVSSLNQPSLFAAVLGGICGFGAVDPHESVFEDIGWAHVALVFMIYIGTLSLGPWDDDSFMLAALWFLGNVLLAAAIGGYAGGLVFKLWKALGPRRFRDHLKPQDPLPAKWRAENEEKIPEVVYFLGIVVGAISTYALATVWLLNWVPARLVEDLGEDIGGLAGPFGGFAAVLGGIAGYGGVDRRESIFRALAEFLPGIGWMSFIIAIVIALAAVLRLGDVAAVIVGLFVGIFGVPAIVGWFAGVLVFNLWKALGR